MGLSGGQEWGGLSTATVTGNRGGKIREHIERCKVTGFGDGQQAGSGQLTIGAAVAEADFAPLHASTERSSGAVVGGLNALVFKESKQSVVVLE